MNIEAMTRIQLEDYVFDLKLQLRSADKLAEAVDEAVKSHAIDARCPVADARLNYGEPYKYKHLNPVKPRRAECDVPAIGDSDNCYDHSLPCRCCGEPVSPGQQCLNPGCDVDEES